MGTKTTHGDPKELDEAKGASSTMDLGMEVSTTNQVNDKAIEASGTLEQLQSRDNLDISRVWAEGDGHIGANLSLLIVLEQETSGTRSKC